MEPIDWKALDECVGRILASEEFRDKRQLSYLLKLLVENLKAGVMLDSDQIKSKLWPRDHTKDEHNIVMAMNRLRDALKSYYAMSGAGDAVRIDAPATPAGARRVKWIDVSKAEEVDKASVTPETQPVIVQRRRRVRPAIGAMLVLVVLFGAISLWSPRIIEPASGGSVGARPTIVGRGGSPWRFHYLVVEPDGGDQFVQSDLGPLSYGWLLGWRGEVHIGDAATKSGTWFYVYVLTTTVKLKANEDYNPVTGQLLKGLVGTRPDNAIRVRLDR
jgi:hypothetical protein